MSSWTLSISFEPCGAAASVRFQSGKHLSSISRSSGVTQLQLFVWRNWSLCLQLWRFNLTVQTVDLKLKLTLTLPETSHTFNMGVHFMLCSASIQPRPQQFISHLHLVWDHVVHGWISILIVHWCTKNPSQSFTYPLPRVVLGVFLTVLSSLSSRPCVICVVSCDWALWITDWLLCLQ